ncbi:hypothetical protein [Alienimonas californiensis]|uniref:Uncharacterized protein n=1 Tax=Alienimonas californiensis TaxID=2527989 RepID=A0A517P6H4_9PLAN|nr:hypothetical protein [Alienimonas californiensis]QDT14953.1 hypothetical protein CA12_10330 [Alienimonas californiensis]
MNETTTNADQADLAAVLLQHLAIYRAMSHTQLAARLKSSQTLDVTDGVLPDGTTYVVETNLMWDDSAKRHVRVIADLSTGQRPPERLLGLIPVYRPDVQDGFIMAPDGSFVDE